MINKKFRRIFKNKSPILVAEISANHNGKLEIAKKLIKCAKDNGADAVKLQTYKPETMTIDSNKSYFKIKKGLWKNYNLWNLYTKAHTPYEWHKELFNYAKKLNILCFSTPFDESAVDLLEKLNCPIYKIASFEMKDFSLIKKVSKTKKPVIISTGMATLSEIEDTYKYAKKCGIKDIALLYCVSNYPSKISDFSLNNIKIMKEKFNCTIGFSDHSKNDDVAFSSVIAGAEIIEKHIALANQKKGFDIDFSLKGKEISRFKNRIELAKKILGKKEFFRNKTENLSKIFRRSIFSIKKIKKGDKFSKENIKNIRPGYGLEPKFFSKLIGRKSPQTFDFGQPLTSNILKKLKIND